MSVILETSLGDITIDLFTIEAPKSCENFLKLCKLKYYNYTPVHTIQPAFTLQTGDPIGPGDPNSDGGCSVWGVLDRGSVQAHGAPTSRKTFTPDFHPRLKHADRGTVSMATVPSPKDPEVREAGSQFLITLDDSLPYLDGKAAPFGRVVEGFDTLEKINNAFIDDAGRPLKDIRIRHTIVLDEAEIPDPPGLAELVPPESPVPSKAQLATVRIADDEELDPNADQDAVEKLRREREARAQALTLEMVGDLPFAEVAPPENVLFVAKLNPVTRDEDLELIFSRFGKVLSCEVIRDKKTGDSLQYAFVEFGEKKEAEAAYFKMQSVLIDDHRIHVDFSQSVSRVADVWRSGENKKRQQRRGGGFGGIEGLEKRRQYRAFGEERSDRERGKRYGMVVEGNGGRVRDRSPGRERDGRRDDRRRDGDRDERRPRRRSPSRSRSPRRRKRSRDRYRDDEYDRKRRRRNPSSERERDQGHRHDKHRERERHDDRRR